MFQLSILNAWGEKKKKTQNKNVSISKHLWEIRNILFKEISSIVKDCWFLLNWFCGKHSSFSPSILYLVPPPLLWRTLAGPVAAKRALPLRAVLRFEPSSSFTSSQPCYLMMEWWEQGRWHRNQTHPCFRKIKSIPWKNRIHLGHRYPSAFLPGVFFVETRAHRRKGCREKQTLSHKQSSALSCPDTLPCPSPGNLLDKYCEGQL